MVKQTRAKNLMAIFHLRVSTVSRGADQSAIAAYCYRNGARAFDRYKNKIQDYRRRRRAVAGRFVVGWAGTKLELWQAADDSETNRDGGFRTRATVAREIQVSIPLELNEQQGAALVERFAAFLADRYGVGIDGAIHKSGGAAKRDRQPHCHLLMTTRRVSASGEFGEKTREWDDRKTGPEQVALVRATWAEMANKALADAGSAERIDHRSLRDQGIDRAPISIPRGALAVERGEGRATPEQRAQWRAAQAAAGLAAAPLPAPPLDTLPEPDQLSAVDQLKEERRAARQQAPSLPEPVPVRPAAQTPPARRQRPPRGPRR